MNIEKRSKDYAWKRLCTEIRGIIKDDKRRTAERWRNQASSESQGKKVFQGEVMGGGRGEK
jgi:hypothetical protein